MSKKKSKRAAGVNKKDLTEKLAHRANIPKIRAAEYIDMLTSIIAEALIDGKKVTISDFGTFNLSERNAFKGYNPQNNEKISVPKRVIPVFRAGKNLKNSLNLPFIKDCSLIHPKQIKVEFSKPLDPKNKKVLTASNYTLNIGKKEGKISSVEVLTTESFSSGKGKSKKGVRSIKITTTQKLFAENFSVAFRSVLTDLEGNESEGVTSWPR
ncbi:MAG: HU family DNA-binding protein [Myxococcota bacterium]|nr:HU family DNA-binding protein [Myxococcota bacterium]